MEDLFTRLLSYYQIDENDYQSLIHPVSEENVFLGHHFNHMEEAVKMVKDSVNNHESIMVYGDYDADGIMATSIIVKMFQYINYSISYYIPSRYIDGYGLTLSKAKEAVENHIKLLITVDNGIAAFEAIDYLRNHDVKVLVLDHHERQEILPNANYIMHPTLSNFGDISSSGAFVSFLFSISFLNRFDKYLSTLASISLISDMMPLKSYNRDLLRLVINNYKEGEFASIDLLKENEIFDETTIGLKIAPKINAIGRVLQGNEVNDLIIYFTSEDNKDILNYIDWINSTNEIRKESSKALSESIGNMVLDDKAIVYLCEEKEGLIGLVSNSLCSKFHVPSIVFTSSINDTLKGSARAPQGFSITECFDSLKDLMVNCGGHALAGGCTIKKEDFEIFKKRFVEYAELHPSIKEETKSIPLGINEITYENYELIQSFSPFGEEWSSPTFALRRIKTDALMFSRDEKHILSRISSSSKLVGFNFPKVEVLKYPYVDLLGKLKVSSYRGFTNLEFNISEIKELNK